jgi:hypothetical protein
MQPDDGSVEYFLSHISTNNNDFGRRFVEE